MTGQKVLGKTHDVSRHRPFFMIYARQQAILKALSKTGGQWQTERQKKDNISGAAKFRDDLDTTRELVRETANVVKTFQTRLLIPPTCIAVPNLRNRSRQYHDQAQQILDSGAPEFPCQSLFWRQ